MSDDEKRRYDLAADYLERRQKEMTENARKQYELYLAALHHSSYRSEEQAQFLRAQARNSTMNRPARPPVETVACPHCDNGVICRTLACLLGLGTGIVTRAMSEIYDQMLETKVGAR